MTEILSKKTQEQLEKLSAPEWNSDDDSRDVEQDMVAEQTKPSKSSRRKQNRQHATNSNVLYIGHLPREFRERELAHFLKQFGKVLNLRLARSKQTNGSKGYAFVKMQTPQIAAIVADTLSGYIMMGQKRLVCHVVPPEKVHPSMFARHKFERKSRPVQVKPIEKLKTVTQRLLKRQARKKAMLEEMGIDYDVSEASKPLEEPKSSAKKKAKKSKRKESIGSVGSESSKSSKKSKHEESIGRVVSESSKKKKRKMSR